ncbi:MAG: FHA domain-containing protein [Planctomycetaceae bacterium]
MARSNHNSRRVRQRRRLVLMLQQNDDTPDAHSHDVGSNDSRPAIANLDRHADEFDSGGYFWNRCPVNGKILGKLVGDKTRFVHSLSRQPVVVIGSGPDCDWSFPGSGLAEQQACFLFFDRRIYCVDLTGTYALQVRGGRFQQIWVHDGSLIEIGSLRLRLQLDQPVSDDAAAPHADVVDATSNGGSSESAGRGEIHSLRQLELRKKGSATPWHYALKREVTLIGREAPSTIRLKDPSLAVISCAIVQTEAGVWQVPLQRSLLNRQTPTAVRCSPWESSIPLQLGIFQLFLQDTIEADRLIPSLAGQRLGG